MRVITTVGIVVLTVLRNGGRLTSVTPVCERAIPVSFRRSLAVALLRLGKRPVAESILVRLNFLIRLIIVLLMMLGKVFGEWTLTIGPSGCMPILVMGVKLTPILFVCN